MKIGGKLLERKTGGRSRYWQVFWLCFAVAAALFLPHCIIDGLNGDFFHYAGDFNDQQISFYSYANNFVKQGGSFSWATDLGSGFGVLRPGGEHLLRDAVLHQLTQQEEGRVVGDTHRLLHIVGDDDDGIALLQFHGQFLDAGGGDGVQCAGGFVHQQHRRLHRQRPCDTQALLLAAGKAPLPEHPMGTAEAL